jgi:hypothetical protein
MASVAVDMDSDPTAHDYLQLAQGLPLVVLVLGVVIVFGLVALFGWRESRRRGE